MNQKFFFTIYKYSLGFFKKLTTSVLNFISLLVSYIETNYTTYISFFKKFFLYFVNWFLFIFITLPWFFFCEFLKPAFKKFYSSYICKLWSFYLIKILFIYFSFFFKTFLFFFGFFFSSLKSVCSYIYVIFLNFLFLRLYRKRTFYRKLILKFLKIFFFIYFYFFFFHFIFWGFLSKYVCLDFLKTFIALDLFTITDLPLFFFFLNPDNFFLYFYTIFYGVGLSNIDFTFLFGDFFMFVFNWYWVNSYATFCAVGDDIVDCSIFLPTFFDNCSDIHHKLTLLSLYDNFLIKSFNCLETPLFFFFGFFFFSTVFVSWFFFSYLGLYGIFNLNLFSLFFFWLSLLSYFKSIFVYQNVFYIKLFNWFFLGLNINIDCYFFIDSISFSFMLLTTTIALFVFIYAFSYFRYEPLVDRFLLFLLSFVISMIFLVCSGNTIMLFLGWELIGLTSFFLINFWTTKTATLKSAFKAFTFNKVSDFFMFMFLLSSYNIYYTFDILSLNTQVHKNEQHVFFFLTTTPISSIEFISLSLVGAAFIKSAQLGGHTWLPDSMEAPVPASSLIHSATLVSAGVYLLLRFNFIFDCTQYSKLIIPLVGSLTAAYGGICAVAQSDIKKTLAYSTISHCGFLMVLCSTEMNEFTILYLYVHGFFKAGVFMCVGNVLRISRGYQDTRRMGGLLKYLPFEYFCSIVGVLNLAGLPFTFGFFIKHLLLLSLENHIYLYYFVLFHSLLGAFSGLFYSFRLVNYTFCDFKKGEKILYTNLNSTSYNSSFYSNSSIAGNISILLLFVSAYVMVYLLFYSFLSCNFLFSDYMNTTNLSNYFSFSSSFNGFLLNFSYVNVVVLIIIIFQFFSCYRKISSIANLILYLSYLILFLLFLLFILFLLSL